MNTFVITGARIVTPDEVIDNGFLYVKKGIIEAVEVVSCQRLHRSLNRIDGRGMWLLPGIINICDRSLEKELAESNIPFDIAFTTVENILADSGVTTVNHRLSYSYSRLEDTSVEVKKLRKYSSIRHDYFTVPISENELSPYYHSKPKHDPILYSCVNALDIMHTHTGFGRGLLTSTKAKPTTVLYSDAYPISILYSIFTLVGSSGISMMDSVKLATLNPARVLGIDRKLGSLEGGKIADLILVRNINGIVMVEKVFVNGFKILEKRSL
ncbi:MAG TPA: amidohydrolase family protein [Clostridia bacterium]|nr:amidohydrolase family protein [Clostridia bacterium]